MLLLTLLALATAYGVWTIYRKPTSWASVHSMVGRGSSAPASCGCDVAKCEGPKQNTLDKASAPTTEIES